MRDAPAAGESAGAVYPGRSRRSNNPMPLAALRLHWRELRRARRVHHACRALFEPLLHDRTNLLLTVSGATQRPIDAALHLFVPHREQIHPHRGEMVRILFQRFPIYGMPLAVEPADRPMIPARRPPVQAAGVGECMFLELRPLVREA